MESSRRWLLRGAGVAGLAGVAALATSEPAEAATRDALGLVDVTAYGAVGDNVTLCSDAVDAAMAAAQEGDVVYFPPGVYRLSRPLVMKRNVTVSGAAPAPRWPYKSGVPSRIKVDTGTWSGAGVVCFQDKEITGAAAELEGAALLNLGVDCVAFNDPAPYGIYATGHCQDIRVENVAVWNSKSSGIALSDRTRADGTVQTCAGWRFTQVTVCQATTGFDLRHVTDSSLDDCLTVSTSGTGYYLVNGSDNHVSGCRAVFGGGHGFWIDGSNGSLQLGNCSTDRMQFNGFYLTCSSGSQAVLLSGCYARRDGAAGGSYAGLRVASATTSPPIIVNGFATHVNRNDDGTGNAGPQYGVLVDGGISFLALNGVSAQGTVAGITDNTGKATKSCTYSTVWKS